MIAAGVLAPVVLPQGAGRTKAHLGVVSLAREPLPLPDLPPQRTSAVVYGASAVDDRRRVADRVVLRALGWAAGHRLDIRESAGMLTVVPDPAGPHHHQRRHPLRREEIINQLWEDADEAVLRQFRVCLYALRTALEPQRPRGKDTRFVRSSEDRLWLDPVLVEIDLDEFRQLARLGVEDPGDTGLTTYRSVAAAYEATGDTASALRIEETVSHAHARGSRHLHRLEPGRL